MVGVMWKRKKQNRVKIEQAEKKQSNDNVVSDDIFDFFFVFSVAFIALDRASCGIYATANFAFFAMSLECFTLIISIYLIALSTA